MERAVEKLREQKIPFDEEWLQYLSPLGWEHINLTGDYIWKIRNDSKFKPLSSIEIP